MGDFGFRAAPKGGPVKLYQNFALPSPERSQAAVDDPTEYVAGLVMAKTQQQTNDLLPLSVRITAA